jgi:hypothetical protein
MTLKLRHHILHLSLGLLMFALWPLSAHADDEASNVAHIAAGSYGRCYAKSVPTHIYDPDDQARQQGFTRIYKVGKEKDVLVDEYN